MSIRHKNGPSSDFCVLYPCREHFCVDIYLQKQFKPINKNDLHFHFLYLAFLLEWSVSSSFLVVIRHLIRVTSDRSFTLFMNFFELKSTLFIYCTLKLNSNFFIISAQWLYSFELISTSSFLSINPCAVFTWPRKNRHFWRSFSRLWKLFFLFFFR